MIIAAAFLLASVVGQSPALGPTPQPNAAPGATQVNTLSLSTVLRGIAHDVSIHCSQCELVARPLDPRTAPLMISVRRLTGDEWSVTYAGFVPGTFDLTDFLVCADGRRPTDLSPLPVLFETVGSSGLQLDTAAPVASPIRRVPAWPWWTAALAWLLLPAILWSVRRLRLRTPKPIETLDFPTRDSLESLLTTLQQRDLSIDERARLELMVLDHVVRRHQTVRIDPFRENLYLFARRDPHAADVLDALEAWLHRPVPSELDAARLRAGLRDLWATPSHPKTQPFTEGQLT
jgi:hypothetical protein